jgi:phospholipase C
VQENRSVDNLFQQLPGADTHSSGLNHKGQTIALQPISLGAPVTPGHKHGAFVTEFDNGKLDGFDLEKCGGSKCANNGAYSYVNPTEVAQYYKMAEQYAFADHR